MSEIGYDTLGRPTLVKEAAGLAAERDTKTQYEDHNRRVVVWKDLNAAGDGLLISVTDFDQLNRPTLSRQLESATGGVDDDTVGIKVQTRYMHPSGASYKLVSSPYRAAQSSAAGTESTMGWGFSYTYQPVGLATETYPSTRKLTLSYDGAGRLSGVSGALSGVTTPYASGLVYAAQNALTGMTLGSGKYEETCYNSRLQPIGIRVGAVATGCANSGDLLNLAFSYGSTNNNGNLNSEGIFASGGANVTQSFGYDNVNRLSTGSEVAVVAGITTWIRPFNYDQWGNMYMYPAGGNPGVLVDQTTPQSSSWIDTAHNRLTNAALGIGYDTAGNMKTINGYAWAYDGENRLTSSTLSGNASTYVYDGDGRRVQKVSGGTTTTYVYDAGGELAAEYTQGAAPPAPPCATCYLTADDLGSTRMVTNASGTIESLHDYLPFGEEIPAGVAGRTTPLYPPSPLTINDTVTEKFTGKERDQETGLDYFGARYLSAAQGRFTSPDEFVGGAYQVGGSRPQKPGPLPYADITNPQSLNKYTYALDNPLRYIDPDGHSTIEFDAKQKKIYVFTWDGDKVVVKSYKAGNNVAVHNKQNKSGFANGPMTNGDHDVANADQHGATAHVGGAADGPYGSHGIIHVDSYKGVTGETIEGAGLHSGRDGPDSLTHGCIRTTDAAMKDINAVAKDDPVTLISVQNNGANIAGWANKAGAAGADVDQSAVQRQVASDAKEDK